MSRCQHTDWIELSRGPPLDSSGARHEGSRVRVVDLGRLDRLVACLPNAATQIPQIVCFVGASEKDEALRQAFPGKKRQTYHNRFADLHLWSTSGASAHPVLFANHDINALIPTKPNPRLCHQSKSFLTDWSLIHQPGSSRAVANVVLTRLLFPFCDVVYLFADDLGGLANTFDRIRCWLAESSQATTLANQKPELIVITTEAASATAMRKEAVFRSQLSQIDHSHRFASITLRRLSSTAVSGHVYKSIRDELLADKTIRDDHGGEANRKLASALARRQQAGAAFSAQCLAWLFHQAVRHLQTTITTPFDIVAAMRIGRPHPVVYADQMRAFLRLATRHAFSTDDMTSILASAIALDAYGGVGHVFPVHETYPMYESSLLEALEDEYVTTVLPSNPQQWPQLSRDLSRTISENMCAWVQQSDTSTGWAMRLHMHTLRRIALSVPWVSVQSNLCCLFCLVHRPEYVLPCGHSYCEGCVIKLGEPTRGYDYSYTVRVCVLCQTAAELCVRMKPPTAGVRIMAIDGGGVRGVIPLALIRQLQDVLGTSCQVQDFFDLILGTSAGGLIALGMFGNKWDVETSTETFARLSLQTFPPSSHGAWVSSLASVARCVINDSAYSGDDFDDTLQDTYGSGHKLFGCPSDRIAQFKIGVTAADTDTAAAVLLTNYNGMALRDGDHAVQQVFPYRCARSEYASDELLVWQSARATSAAPFFFSPAISMSGEEYQDGGFAHQNPAPVAVLEAQRIWGDNVAYDITLSFGTGVSNTSPARTTGSRSRLEGCALLRCFRWGVAHARQSLDGHLAHPWTRMLLPVYARPDCHRLDVTIPGRLPRMDDSRCMSALRSQVDAGRDDTLLRNIAVAMLASCFYFELDGAPVYSFGQFVCRGTLRIRGDYVKVISALKGFGVGRIEFLRGTDILVTSSVDDLGCRQCACLALPIKLVVRHLEEEPITISIRIDDHPMHRVSGFPHSMQWFMDRQGLSNPFGVRHIHPGCWCDRTGSRRCKPDFETNRPSRCSEDRRKTRRRTRRRRTQRRSTRHRRRLQRRSASTTISWI